MARNRRGLRRLGQTVPSDDDVYKLLSDLSERDDIHAAIMGVSLVKGLLEKVIIKELVDSSEGLLEKLTQSRGPLSDFHSKILIAQAFGIISVITAEELDSLRVIRNTFAHAKVPVSFDHDPVAQEIESLKLTALMMKAAREFDASHGFHEDDDRPRFQQSKNKATFLMALFSDGLICGECGSEN